MRRFTGQPGDHVVVLNWKDRDHPAAGGAETFCHEVAERLLARGLRVTMVVSRPPGAASQDVIGGVRVRRLGSTFTVYPLVLLWLLKNRRSVQAVIDSQNGLPFFSPLAVRRRTPVTMVVHHVHQEQFRLYFPPLAAVVGRWLERTGSRLVYRTRPISAVSPSTRSEVRRTLGLEGPIFVAPNGHEPVRAVGATRAQTPTIVCVGRLVTHKRWDVLLHTVARIRHDVPGLQVHLVGTGPAVPELERLVDSLGLHEVVTLHGYVAAAVRDELLASAWLTASTSRGEGWGLAIIEAASFGVPAVAFDVTGLRDSVRHGRTGWLAREDTLDEVLVHALELLASPSAAARTASECRAWSTQLTWDATTDRLLAVLAQEAQHPGRDVESRLARPDLVSMVTLTAEAAREVDTTRLRLTDQTNFCSHCVGTGWVGPFRLLLPGADEDDARRAVARVSGGAVDEADVEVAPARPMDLLTWNGFGTAHNFRSPAALQRCPHPVTAEVTGVPTQVVRVAPASRAPGASR